MTDPILERDSVLAEMVRRLVNAFGPERIYLFGSKARGDARPDSDYDLVMVLREAHAPAHRLAQQAHALLWGLDASADILVWSKSDFDWRAGWKSSLPATVLGEGRLLYAG
ncbi:MAG: nucleotidyltransferase domain-containing protein [Acidobacteriota bacterium]